jgi:hypothetical protein
VIPTSCRCSSIVSVTNNQTATPSVLPALVQALAYTSRCLTVCVRVKGFSCRAFPPSNLSRVRLVGGVHLTINHVYLGLPNLVTLPFPPCRLSIHQTCCHLLASFSTSPVSNIVSCLSLPWLLVTNGRSTVNPGALPLHKLSLKTQGPNIIHSINPVIGHPWL